MDQDDPRAAGLAHMLEEHRAELLRFLTARCGSLDEAQDVMQDLWIRANTQPAGPVSHPRAYLFRMANNMVLDRARSLQRSMRRERAWLEEGGFVPAPETRIDPAEPADEAISRQQEADMLQTAIDQLPKGAARALRLYRFEGKSQGEIAQILGISRSGVEKHLAVAMKHLRLAFMNCVSGAAVTSRGEEAEGDAKSGMEKG